MSEIRDLMGQNFSPSPAMSRIADIATFPSLSRHSGGADAASDGCGEDACHDNRRLRRRSHEETPRSRQLYNMLITTCVTCRRIHSEHERTTAHS